MSGENSDKVVARSHEDKAVSEESKGAPEWEYRINEPVPPRNARASDDEEYRIVEDPEMHTLSGIFARVGAEFGLNATAFFSPMREMKISWIGFSSIFRFEVSDFLQGAPESIIESLARTTIFKMMRIDADFPEEVERWLTAPEFSERHRALYIERNPDIGSEVGERKSLKEAVDRLVEKGLVERDPSIMVAWSNGREKNRSAWSYPIMKVAWVNKALDSDDVPDEVLDMAILKHLVKIRERIAGDRNGAEDTANEIVNRCPGYDETVEWLEEHNLTF